MKIDQKINNTLTKYYSGHHITTAELKSAIKHLKLVSKALSNMGPKFHLAWQESNFILIRMEDWVEARQRLGG